MKRNFYALFALLTALSGPLVMAPPAISKANTESRVDETSATDDDVVSDARFEQEHNQPRCQFPVDSFEAPENLIVLPEDFDYELFAEKEACESPLIAESKPGDKDLPQTSDLPNFEGEPAFDHLCLPFVEWDGNVQPWDGPPIAGTDSSPLRAAAILEAEAAPITGGAWAANLIARGTYGVAAALSQSVHFASAESIDAIRSIDELEIAAIRHVLDATVKSVLYSWEDLTCRYASFSYSVSSKGLAAVERHQPERPFCYCWAKEDLVTKEASKGTTGLNVEQNQLEFASTCPTDGQVAEIDELPAIPQYDVQANDTGDLQNDAIGQLQSDAHSVSDCDQTLDLTQLEETAKQAWEMILDKAAMLDRWSKDYDFEPFSAPKVEEPSEIE